MDTFGEWLQQQRKLRRLTREGLANRVGCSVAMLRKIEYGERRPSTQIAELIANALEIPSAEHETFVRVARGELRVERISHLSNPIQDSDTSPARTVSRNNLPVLPTPLIGRIHELNDLGRFLRDPQCRLLTLVGPGGIGKTRLAIESASRMQNKFEDGVYFVPLVPVNSSRFIVPVMADSVGFTFQSANPVDPKAQLFSYLKEKHMLLLIDNIEHLLKEPDIELFPELLAMAPKMKLLFTSREPLNLQAEWVFEVQGLPVPKDPQTESIIQGTSIELFIQRARRANAGFSAETRDLPAIAHICQLVDGMPLGIELAAAWVRTLSCEEIAHEIERGLDILHVSARDLPARHRSMRAVFEHSWKLLNEEEQAVLLRLSIFRGGFQREAAEQVAGATLSMLSALVTKSLIRRISAGRYDLHELIRQYAADRLADQPKVQKEVQEHHGNYYLTYFGQADSRLRSSVQGKALAELSTEMDNFRTAWDWAIAHDKFALIEQTLRTLETLYTVRGRWQEGFDTLGRALTALETAYEQSPLDRTNQVALGHVLATCSLLAYRLTKYKQAQAMLECSLEILRPLNETRVLVETIAFLGVVMLLTGNFNRAQELLGEGLEMATEIGDRWFAAYCLIEQANVARLSGNVESAYQQLRSVVADLRSIGDPHFTSFGLNFLSSSAITLRQYDVARTALEESIALNKSVDDRWGLGLAYRGLGVIAQTQGEHQQAVDMFRKSLDTFNGLDTHWDVATVLSEMGRSLFALGNDLEAGRAWHESLCIAVEIHGIPVVLYTLIGIADLLAKRGDLEHAFEVTVIVSSHPASSPDTRNRAICLRAELEAQLTSSQCEAIQAHAGEKTFEAVVDDLLK